MEGGSREGVRGKRKEFILLIPLSIKAQLAYLLHSNTMNT